MRFLFLFHLLGIVAASDQMRCVFLHGVGILNSSAATTSDTDDVWGGDLITKYTPYCSSRMFLHQDTVRNGWDDIGLQQAACVGAVGEGSSDNVIRNTIVFSHSMGNLVFAAALQRGLCSFDLVSSKWISIEAPWLGSKAASWVHNICSNHTTSKTLRWGAKKLYYCDTDRPGQVFRSYESLKPDYPGLSDLLKIGSTYVTRSLCGTSPFGLTTVYSAAFEALAEEVQYGEANDGMVAVDSCMLPGRTYKEHYANPFYLAKINHVDGTCYAGDGYYGKGDRQPCSWIAGALNTTGQSILV